MRAVTTILALCAVAFAAPATAQDDASRFGKTSASVTYGPYLRVEAGAATTRFEDETWLPPGPGDPRVFFDFGSADGGVFGVAAGFDWMNGFRADLGLLFTGDANATGPWSYTSPAVAGPHADITAASVRTTALMGSLYYSPLEQRRINSRVQPYLVAGLGLARNRMSGWTRERAGASIPVRSFEGGSAVDLAYSFGLGVAWQATRTGRHPVIVDLGWRYYDFGTATGGTTPLTDTGNAPREGLKLTRRDSVVSIGVRVPLRRY